MRTRLALFTTALLLGFGGVASAQAPGFYPERFEPMPDQGINLLNLSSSQVLGHLLPSAGLFLQYLYNPLQLVTGDDGNVLSREISHQVKADLWASFGFANVVELSVVLPFVLDQAGSDPEHIFRNSISSAALGDLRVIPKLKLIDAADAGGFGLAVLVNLSLPTGSQDSFTSDGKVRVEPKIALDWTDKDSGFSVVANVGLHLRPTRTIHNLVVGNALTWGAGVRVPTPLDELKLVGSVFGAVPFDKNVDPITGLKKTDLRSTPVELDVAAELSLGDFVGDVGAGFGLTKGFGEPDYRLFLSFGYVPRCQDPDGDGICSQTDDCPDAPEDFDGFQDTDGCPDLDNDKDGVPDLSDGPLDATGFGKCRDNPEDKDGFEDEDGCPDLDNDHDGIPDVRDGAADPNFPGFGMCRGVDADKPEFTNAAEDKDGFQDDDGCPDLDNDGDGILDLNDGAKDATGFGQCRDQPEDVDGFQDDDGCPDPDNDGDGELDVNDGPAIDTAYPGFGICRDAPGLNEEELKAKGFAPPWKWQDAKKPYPGCPMVIASCQCGQIIITQMVQFRYNSAALSPDSYSLLDAVASVLVDKKCASKVRVEGHTDWHGTLGYNDNLSQRRAESVMNYLTKKGIAKDRLMAKGYGERKPLDPKDHKKVCDRCTPGCTCEPGSAKEPNADEDEIRRLNRRVQFNIMELTNDVSGTTDQCPVDY